MKSFPITIALLVAAAPQAHAQPAGAPLHVSYGDLNLQTKAGVRTLDRRLAAAVESVCGLERGSVDMERTLEARRCVRDKAAELAPQRNEALAARAAPVMVANRSR